MSGGCGRHREQLSARADGELTEAEDAELHHHLEQCLDCREWQSRIADLSRVTRVRAAEPVPDLAAAIVSQAHSTTSPALEGRRRIRPLCVVAAGIVFAVLGMAQTGVLSRSPSSPEPILSIDAVATASSGSTGAVYLAIANDGGQDELVGAVADGTGDAVLHRTAQRDGLVVMVRDDRIEISDSATTILGPSGAHVMIRDLASDLRPGDVITVRLDFARSRTIEVPAPVVRVSDVPAHLWAAR